nr:DUF397 domain-containing protein [Streptomyces sp. NBC_00886]
MSAPTGSIPWHKSSFSGVDAENCLELAHHEGRILLRESDTPSYVLALDLQRLRTLIQHCGGLGSVPSRR